jgi:hypothetical protein
VRVRSALSLDASTTHQLGPRPVPERRPNAVHDRPRTPVRRRLEAAARVRAPRAWGGYAHCGVSNVVRQRHCVLPISRGGRYTLANVVPAVARATRASAMTKSPGGCVGGDSTSEGSCCATWRLLTPCADSSIPNPSRLRRRQEMFENIADDARQSQCDARRSATRRPPFVGGPRRSRWCLPACICRR